jgi:hypothetical protein
MDSLSININLTPTTCFGQCFVISRSDASKQTCSETKRVYVTRALRSHIISSSLSSTLTASSLPPAHATKRRKKRVNYKFSSPFHYVTRALQNKRGCALILMTSDSKLRASYISNEGFGSKWCFVILSLFHKLHSKSQSVMYRMNLKWR